MVFPKISIITPVYNQVKYIEATILSVINQDYPNLEYIIIDGGSTDGTLDIIKKYESRISSFVSEPDQGMYHALQKGFDKTTGEIMGWLNADDIYFTHSLFAIASVFTNNPQINWITSNYAAINEEGVIIRSGAVRCFTKYHFYMNDYQWVPQESTVWRRTLWEKAGGRIDYRLRYAGDFELWLRFFKYDRLFHIDTLIGAFRNREGQLSGSIEKYLEEVNRVYSELAIPKEDKQICKKYKQRTKIASIINKTRLFNGNKILRISSFERKYFNPPPVVFWDRNYNSFKLTDEY